MHIIFPETQDGKTPALQESIAQAITLSVDLLDGIQACIESRVCMPEIPVPLNDIRILYQQDIDNKPPPNDLLFTIDASQPIKNGSSCGFKTIRLFLRRKPQDAGDTFLVCRIIPARITTILPPAICPEIPRRNIPGLPTRDALKQRPFGTPVHGSLPRRPLRFRACLPRIGTVQRTKTTSPPRVFFVHRRDATPGTRNRTTGIARTLETRSWRVGLLTKRTDFLLRFVFAHT